MNEGDFKNLSAGDIVRHKMSSEAAIVHANYGSHIIAVRTFHLTNPQEWDLIYKADLKRIASKDT